MSHMVTAAGTDASPVSGTESAASCCIRPAAPASPDSRLPCFGARQGGAPVPAPLGEYHIFTSYKYVTYERQNDVKVIKFLVPSFTKEG